MNDFLTVKEFSEAAKISQQAVYKQMSGRLAPYVSLINGQRRISREALLVLYGVEYGVEHGVEHGVEQPEPTGDPSESEDNPQNSDEGHKSNSTGSCKPDSTEFNRVEQLLQEQLEAEKRQNEFLREQIQQKDRTIESLSENLRMAQQLAAADKQKLLKLEEKIQMEEQDPEPVEVVQESGSAAEQDQVDQGEPVLQQQAEEKPKGLWQRIRNWMR